MRRSWTLALAMTLAGAVALGAGCGKKQEGGKPGGPGGRGPMKFPVQVEQVQVREVEYAVDAVGTVEAFEKVQVTARVQGVVDKVSFAEGTLVKKDQVLAEIEPLRFKLAVDSAKAALDKALAERDDALSSLQRREAVQQENPGLIRGEELDTFRTRGRTAEAEAEARRVALEQARLNLRDAYVRAPVAGVIETRTVQTGQYVQPGGVLATLVQREPLLVRFRVPEVDSARLEPGMEARFRTSDGPEPFGARVTHVAQAADERNRMIEVTAEVTDERRAVLRPGSFAEVTVPVSALRAAVIPQTAIRPSERGFLAFVVDGELARERVVQLGMRTPDGRVEVRGGLREGETLVVRGAEALRDGATVRVAAGPGDGTPPPETGALRPEKKGAPTAP